MNKKHIFFAVAVAANQFVQSTSTVDDDPMTKTNMDEERVGKQVLTLLGKELQVHVEEPEPVKQITSKVGETSQQPISLLGQEIWPAPKEIPPPPPKTFMLFGEKISVPATVHPEELGHDLRDVKRKQSSRDEAQSQQIKHARAGEISLSDLIKIWGFDVSHLEERRKEFSTFQLPDELKRDAIKVKLMAIGSIYVEHQRPTIKLSRSLLTQTNVLKDEVKKNAGVIEQLGLDRNKVEKEALNIYRNEPNRPRVREIAYMAMGVEYYRSLHSRG